MSEGVTVALIRGCDTREVYFSIGGEIQSWFPAPDESPVSDNVHAGGDVQTLLNGFAYMSGSVYGHKSYELMWPYLKREQADIFRRLFMTQTGTWVTYLDPFSFGNILSPVASLPYLHYHIGSPFAFNDYGKQALFPTKALNSESMHPSVLLKAGVLQTEFDRAKLNSHEVSLALAHSGQYVERFAIPDGYEGQFVARGPRDAGKPFSFTFTQIGPGTSGTPAIKDGQKNTKYMLKPGIWELSITPGTGGVLDWCRLEVNKEGMTDQSEATDVPYVSPSGGGNLQVVPGSAKVVTVNAHRGHFTASVALKEVYPW